MKRVLVPLALAALAACSPERDSETQAEVPVNAGLAEVNAQPIVAPTGSARLTPLAASAVAAVGGDDGCSFAYQERLLLIVGDNAGAAVVDGTEVRLKTVDDAGQGPVLQGGGYTFTVRQAGGPSSDLIASDLIISGPSGETIFSPGTWSCAG